MGGDATFSGTDYQGSVIAFVFVHILSETKLRWLTVEDDTPSAVSGEVGGPGDDLRIEFGSAMRPIEVQAKHGLKPQKAIEAIRAMAQTATTADVSASVLAVDPSSSAAIKAELRRDLDRLRSGRTDGLRDLSERLRGELGHDGSSVLNRLHPRVIDVVTCPAMFGPAEA